MIGEELVCHQLAHVDHANRADVRVAGLAAVFLDLAVGADALAVALFELRAAALCGEHNHGPTSLTLKTNARPANANINNVKITTAMMIILAGPLARSAMPSSSLMLGSAAITAQAMPTAPSVPPNIRPKTT